MSLSLPALQWLQDGYAGFAWPWAWLAFPLPWLVRWAWPPRRAQADALRVPYGHAVQAIAAQGGRGLPGRGAALAWLVWFLLGNLPFILIQRYNRPRLIRLRALLQRREQRKGNHEHPDTDL